MYLVTSIILIILVTVIITLFINYEINKTNSEVQIKYSE